METVSFVELDELNQKLRSGKAVVRIESWMTDEQIGNIHQAFYGKMPRVRLSRFSMT